MLHLARREVVVIVQTNLTNRAHIRILFESTRNQRCRRVGIVCELVSLMGMDAHSKPHPRPGRAHLAGLDELGIVLGGQDDQTPGDANIPSAGDDGMEIRGELTSCQMAVRIDHRTRVPGGGGLSNDSSAGAPPSGLAARTMPFDSTPISVAG